MSEPKSAKDLLDELKWRGLIEQHTDWDVILNRMSEGKITFYCGFDPTAPSLHHGHLVQLILMKHLQNAGHHPIAVVGGATGLIGDPRLVGERTLNPKETVATWVENLRQQIGRFLDLEGKNPAILVNNLDWTENLSAIDLLRDIGKHFRIGTMISRDIVARRLNSAEGISYTEFSYQILQSYDYLELYRRYNCTLQTGGNDQWGNLVSGVDLIHKVTGAQVSVLTTPLITKADGTKFGKSEGGAIWLDPQLFSPYDFYQFWLQVADEDVIRLLKVFTFVPKVEIEQLELEVSQNPQERKAQRLLASEVTRLVHGEHALEQVQAATAALWGQGDLSTVEADVLLSAVEHLPKGKVILGKDNLVDAICACGLESGRSAAIRLIRSKGLSLNNEKVEDLDQVLTSKDLLPGGLILLRKGRRNLAVVFPEGE